MGHLLLFLPLGVVPTHEKLPKGIMFRFCTNEETSDTAFCFFFSRIKPC